MRVRLATPMLGGGSEAGQPDPDQPFRPSAIRGALRRWWRASNAFASPADMRRRERDLWGMADGNEPTSSRVRVLVEFAGVVRPEPLGQVTGRNDYRIFGNIPSYLVGFYSNALPELMFVPEGPEFSIRVLYMARLADDQKMEVARAFATWLHLGGVGARTRRGFGALEVLSAKPEPLLKMIAVAPSLSKAHASQAVGHTTLSQARQLLGPVCAKNTAMQAWADAASALQNYRRGEGRERRSPWPEPDSLRMRKNHEAKWKREAVERFPRAEFGLPLNIHSADHYDFDSSDLTFLLGEGKDRLPSPLIIRPTKVDGKWRPYAVLLSHTPLATLGVPTDAKGTPYTKPGVDADILVAFWKYLRLHKWENIPSAQGARS